MLERLKRLYQDNILRAIDYQFCQLIAEQEQQVCGDRLAGWAALSDGR